MLASIARRKKDLRQKFHMSRQTDGIYAERFVRIAIEVSILIIPHISWITHLPHPLFCHTDNSPVSRKPES
jgi:hypothetical protein